MGSITIHRDYVDLCYVDSLDPTATNSTFNRGHDYASFAIKSVPLSGTEATQAAFMQFTIPKKETTSLSSKAYVSSIQLHFNVNNGGDNMEVFKVMKTLILDK